MTYLLAFYALIACAPVIALIRMRWNSRTPEERKARLLLQREKLAGMARAAGDGMMIEWVVRIIGFVTGWAIGGRLFGWLAGSKREPTREPQPLDDISRARAKRDARNGR